MPFLKNKRENEFAIIGLGHFGGSLARRLEALGHPVLGIDIDPQLVKEIADEITPDLNTIGRLVIIFTMFAGRLGAVTIMIALLARDPGKKLVDYPEESILIG